MGCEKMKRCPFFAKFKDNFGKHYQVIIQSYCQGKLSDMCKRKKYESEEGGLAPGNLCPSGHYSKGQNGYLTLVN